MGASRADQLDEALAVSEKSLDGALKTRLDELTRDYRFGDDIR